MGVQEVMDFTAEKLKEAPLALENLGSEALARFNKVFPPERRGDKISHWFHVALSYFIAAVVLTLTVYLCGWCCKYCCRALGGASMKKMKAPGRNCMMPRATFEGDPRRYFRGLRSHPGDHFC